MRPSLRMLALLSASALCLAAPLTRAQQDFNDSQLEALQEAVRAAAAQEQQDRAAAAQTARPALQEALGEANASLRRAGPLSAMVTGLPDGAEISYDFGTRVAAAAVQLIIYFVERHRGACLTGACEHSHSHSHSAFSQTALSISSV